MSGEGEKLVVHGPQTGPCAVCGKAGKACGRCFVDFYCGKEHQVQHWPRHKKGCGCVVVRRDAVVGRHLVAAKAIPAGTVFMREVPLVAYPSPNKSGAWDAELLVPLCVGCCAEIPPRRRRGSCSLCGWPLCDAACGGRPEHRLECAAFQRAGFKLKGGGTRGQWFALGALRVCLASKELPHGARLQELQSELPDPTENASPDGSDPDGTLALRLSKWQESRRSRRWVADWLRGEVGLSWLGAEELQRWAGVASLNSRNLCDYGPVSGVFACTSLLEHACVPTVMPLPWASGRGGREGGSQPFGDLEYVLVAARDVAAGEHLSITYVEPLRSKVVRRGELAAHWGFRCACALCRDPDEGGLRLANWYCGHCKDRGCQQLVALDADAVLWHCEGCGRRGPVRGEPVRALGHDGDAGRDRAAELHEQLLALRARGDTVLLSEWESLLSEGLWPRGPLHATSQTVLLAKEAMTHLDDVSQMHKSDFGAQCARLAGYCRDLLDAVGTLCPGHLDLRRLRLKRLALHTRNRLVALCMALRTSPRSWPRLKKDAQALKQEVAELLPELKRCAITPPDQQFLQGMTHEFETAFKRVLPPC